LFLVKLLLPPAARNLFEKRFLDFHEFRDGTLKFGFFEEKPNDKLYYSLSFLPTLHYFRFFLP
jgi:hypothetical protein